MDSLRRKILTGMALMPFLGIISRVPAAVQSWGMSINSRVWQANWAQQYRSLGLRVKWSRAPNGVFVDVTLEGKGLRGLMELKPWQRAPDHAWDLLYRKLHEGWAAYLG